MIAETRKKKHDFFSFLSINITWLQHTVMIQVCTLNIDIDLFLLIAILINSYCLYISLGDITNHVQNYMEMKLWQQIKY